MPQHQGRRLAGLALTGPAAAQHDHHATHPADHDPRLDAELEAVRAATERYRDHDNAFADGYVLFGGEGPVMGEHWYRRDLVGWPLDLERPRLRVPSPLRGLRVTPFRVCRPIRCR